MSVPTTDSAMYKTMHSQPAVIRHLLENGWEPASDAAGRLATAERVHITGIGTSYHASLMGAWLLRAAGCDARAISSYDFAMYPDNFRIGSNDAVIIMTHTGIKRFSADAIARASRAGATVISVGSLTAEHPGSDLILRTTERETSAAYTASHTAAMTVLAQIATALGEQRGEPGVSGFVSALADLPDQMEDILSREDDVLPVSREAVNRRIYAAGAGPNEVAAIESVIKVREAAYGDIDGLALEQFLHGPIVAFNEGNVGVLVNVSGASEARVGEVATVLDAMGGMLWIVGKEVDGLGNATVFPVPETVELLSPLLTTIPMQILAYQMAVIKGVHPDTFRRDDPRYGEAFGKISL